MIQDNTEILGQIATRSKAKSELVESDRAEARAAAHEEAAHIWPYRGDHDNHPDNGLLLRSDLHTMFDLDLLGIEPGSLAVHLHPSARFEDYARLAGRRLMISRSGRPSADALRSRFDAFHERLND